MEWPTIPVEGPDHETALAAYLTTGFCVLGYIDISYGGKEVCRYRGNDQRQIKVQGRARDDAVHPGAGAGGGCDALGEEQLAGVIDEGGEARVRHRHVAQAPDDRSGGLGFRRGT